MIVFFAFTNANVAAMLNVKINYFKDEEGYLLVKGSPIISEELLNNISNTSVFNAVYVIDVPLIDLKQMKWGKIKGVRSFERAKIINKYYAGILDKYFSEKKCEKIFISGGWNNANYLTNYFCKKNRGAKVILVEEGTSVYSQTRKQLYNIRPEIRAEAMGKITSLIYRMAERKYTKIGRKCLSKEIYVYSKETYLIENSDKQSKLIELPKVDESHYILKNILQEYMVNYKELWNYYARRKVIYLSDYIFEAEHIRLIRFLLDRIEASRIIIKVHTSATKHKLEFAKDIETKYKELFVDRETYYFESICSVIDFSNKILISRGSSIMAYVKLIYGQEPYLIFTYRLFSEYTNKGDINLNDNFVKTMRRLYVNKEKIMVPTSMYEYKKMLEKAYLDCLGY